MPNYPTDISGNPMEPQQAPQPGGGLAQLTSNILEKESLRTGQGRGELTETTKAYSLLDPEEGDQVKDQEMHEGANFANEWSNRLSGLETDREKAM